MRGACALFVIAALLPSVAFSEDRLSDLRGRFAQETNAVRKARLMPDLGDAEFQKIAKNVEGQQLPDALAQLQQYRDQARACMEGLDALKIDADKHPAGFKQLEISLSESMRRLNALLSGMTGDQQTPFLEVRKELDEMNRHLIDELFPGRPAPKQKPAPKP